MYAYTSVSCRGATPPTRPRSTAARDRGSRSASTKGPRLDFPEPSWPGWPPPPHQPRRDAPAARPAGRRRVPVAIRSPRRPRSRLGVTRLRALPCFDSWSQLATARTWATCEHEPRSSSDSREMRSRGPSRPRTTHTVEHCGPSRPGQHRRADEDSGTRVPSPASAHPRSARTLRPVRAEGLIVQHRGALEQQHLPGGQS